MTVMPEGKNYLLNKLLVFWKFQDILKKKRENLQENLSTKSKT